ncbi:MAG TPA: Gfo/Idh/MocA family oxidoreductase [Sphingomicrobium sp.]|nr:Gfo/Idh/MocA family oxidoreductase [Sphingomicrobium sp.]
MSRSPIRIALVGIGKIARDQHIPALAASSDYELVAAVTRHGPVEGISTFGSITEMRQSGLALDAVSLCTPPLGRHVLAREAIAAGLHVMLEKPPGATVSEVESLALAARKAGLALFATWHTRAAPAIERARSWLAGRRIGSATIIWREDVRQWHPGQAWIWEPGGFGVFDPGINALSAATAILPQALFLTDASLFYPENRAMPIAAHLSMSDSEGIAINADFDWRERGTQRWDIDVETDAGRLTLSKGGAALAIDGETLIDEDEISAEYPNLYVRFAELVRSRMLDVDLAPLRLVADAFMLGRRVQVDPFVE